MRSAITSQPVHHVEDYEKDLAAWNEIDSKLAKFTLHTTPKPSPVVAIVCLAVLLNFIVLGTVVWIWTGPVHDHIEKSVSSQ